eukprot:Gb_36005 [translate_table: standard]
MALFLVRIALVISVLPMSNSIHQDTRVESAAIPLQISRACKATQYPDLCKSSLMRSPVATKRGRPPDIIEAALGLSAGGVKHSHFLCQTILAASSGNFNLTIAAQNCLESLNVSIRLISKSSSAPIVEKRIKDVKAWMSAALTRQYGAHSSFRNVNTTEQVRNTMEQIYSVMCLISNALSMVDALDTYGNDIISWKPPQTERSNSSVKPTGTQKTFSMDMPTLRELIPNVIVSKDNSSAVNSAPNHSLERFIMHIKAGIYEKIVTVYSSIQAAVNSAPDDSSERFIIYIKAGIYEEIVTIPPTKTNLMFIGDGMDQTLITGSMNAQQPGIGTYGSATVGVNADGFVARDIAFENTAGPESHQAVALRADCDLCTFQNCAFLGYQDTLYAHTLRQFYKDCRIEGTVDFIFGNSASVFHNCLILVRPRQLSSSNGETNTITAHGRMDPAQSTGFVFYNCTINGTEEFMRNFLANPNIHRTYLGRPWKQYSRTVFMHSYMAQIIQPEGWLAWDGTFALDTLFYGEYQNFGPGANLSARVPWATQVSPFILPLYSLQSFIQGDEWLSATKM